MRHNSDRTVTVKKTELIAKIKENKESHIAEYEKAVEAYKVEAKRQLREQTKKLRNGELDLYLNLVSPVNNSSEYDKIVKMFEWELKDEVELSQGEFNQYVLDELPFSIRAKSLNNTYLGR